MLQNLLVEVQRKPKRRARKRLTAWLGIRWTRQGTKMGRLLAVYSEREKRGQRGTERRMGWVLELLPTAAAAALPRPGSARVGFGQISPCVAQQQVRGMEGEHK